MIRAADAAAADADAGSSSRSGRDAPARGCRARPHDTVRVKATTGGGLRLDEGAERKPADDDDNDAEEDEVQ